MTPKIEYTAELQTSHQLIQARTEPGSLERKVATRLLDWHFGRNRAVKSPDLAAYLQSSERIIRDTIHHLRVVGLPVQSSERGFWWPASREDAVPGMAWMLKRFNPMRLAFEGTKSGLELLYGPPSLFDITEDQIMPEPEPVSSGLPAANSTN